jgi:hypothetical protein
MKKLLLSIFCTSVLFGQSSIPNNIQIKNLPAAINSNFSAVTTALATKQTALGYSPLNPANNLSDVANVSTALTNLGLGTAATKNTGTSGGTLCLLNATACAFLNSPTVPTATFGDNTTNVASTAFVQAALAGLGTASVVNTGTSGATVCLLNGSACTFANSPLLPTPTTSDISTAAATTAFVRAAIAAFGGGGGGGGSAFNWQGTWSSITAYAVNDVVYLAGSSYIATATSTNQPPPNSLYWDLMTSPFDPNGSVALAGGLDIGVGSGKTGYTKWLGATSGYSGFSVNDIAGVSLLYLLPNIDTTGLYIKDTGTATCPTWVDSPTTNCHQLTGGTPPGGGGGGGGGSTVSIGLYSALPSEADGAVYKTTDGPYTLYGASGVWNAFAYDTPVSIPPSPTTLTAIGASGTITAAGGAWLVTSGTTGSYNAWTQSSPSVPYTLDLGSISLASTASPGNATSIGIALSDGSNYILITFGYSGGGGLQYGIQYQSGLSGFVSDPFLASYFPMAAPIVFLRVVVDSTNRTYYVGDGTTYTQFYQEAATNFITVSQVGIAMFNAGTPAGVGKVLHYLVH